MYVVEVGILFCMAVINGSFQAECSRLQKSVVLEKCRELLLRSGPTDANWRWAAEYISKYGEPVTPTGVNINIKEKRTIETVPLSERVAAIRRFVVATPDLQN
jgi:hypothetical protein